MASIKALKNQTIHQIQSGQVIVDLCSVVKELLENSVDAGATSIEVRFREHGLEAIEVQDNGSGIAPENHESLALKHHTSKLSSYDDISLLQTFGFRGEALSSLCALSKFHVVTAQNGEAPKGTRLDFDQSGRLVSSQVVACQQGTTVIVEDLFANLPVRRRELEKNIRREYGKVLGILQAYACIMDLSRISVSNVLAKGKKVVAFATKPRSTTRENIASVFGSKTLSALVAMDLQFAMQPTRTVDQHDTSRQVRILGHVSRPMFAGGRNAPDRQMFFVNKRPCLLPQVAKVFNEVYKSYNNTQSPFIFANIMLDTNAYDVNVSPDKRTILLHDQSSLLESLRSSLTKLFDEQDQVVPESQKLRRERTVPDQSPRTLSANQGVTRSMSLQDDAPNQDFESKNTEDGSGVTEDRNVSADHLAPNSRHGGAMSQYITNQARGRLSRNATKAPFRGGVSLRDEEQLHERSHSSDTLHVGHSELDSATASTASAEQVKYSQTIPGRSALDQASHDSRPTNTSDFITQAIKPHVSGQPPQISSPARISNGVVPSAFERMRPRRHSPEIATVTIGNKTMSSVLGSSSLGKRTRSPGAKDSTSLRMFQRFQSFTAPGTRTVGLANQSRIGHVQKRRESSDTSQIAEENSDAASDIESYQALARDDSSQSAEGAEMEIEIGDQGSNCSSPDNGISDDEYIDEAERKARDQDKISHLIKHAERATHTSQIDEKQRISNGFRSIPLRDHTQHLKQIVNPTLNQIDSDLVCLTYTEGLRKEAASVIGSTENMIDIPIDEDNPSLVILKDDFSSMHIVGQFNLGFILATRNGTDLFIIDQHASDEIFNFERLQRTTLVQNQRLVHPQRIELTAADEEIIEEYQSVLLKNGFEVSIDTSGKHPVGQRCQIVSLPMSKETTFGPSDLEELISLLADDRSIHSGYIPRPSKIRRMFAMRACRSSVMIGKTLTGRQMEGIVRRMGQIDKPWNCPHGRPTMRHVCGLGQWNGWSEGDGLVDEDKDTNTGSTWKAWLDSMDQAKKDEGEDVDEKSEDGEDDDDQDDQDDEDEEEDEEY